MGVRTSGRVFGSGVRSDALPMEPPTPPPRYCVADPVAGWNRRSMHGPRGICFHPSQEDVRWLNDAEVAIGRHFFFFFGRCCRITRITISCLAWYRLADSCIFIAPAFFSFSFFCCCTQLINLAIVWMLAGCYLRSIMVIPSSRSAALFGDGGLGTPWGPLMNGRWRGSTHRKAVLNYRRREERLLQRAMCRVGPTTCR